MMRSWLPIMLLFLSPVLFSQSPLHVANSYGYDDGLNNLLIYCMQEDSRGFLWLGTQEGLNRFDGLQFKAYFHEKENPNSLAHNKVFDIIEYQPGLLLFATGRGLSVLNIQTGQFENQRITYPQLMARSGAIVSSLYQDPEGRIWVNHSGEIDVLDENLDSLYRFTDLAWAQSLKGKISRYEDWYMDQQGRLWVPTDDAGLQIVDFNAETVFHKDNNPEQLQYLEYSTVRSFLPDEENNILWLGVWGEGLLRFDLTSGTMNQELFGIPLRDESRTINTLVQTFHGSILFAINGSCYEMDPVTMEYAEVVSPESAITGRRAQVGNMSLLRTTNHQYWIGGEGLFQLNDEQIQEQLIVNPTEDFHVNSDLLISGSGKIFSVYDNGFFVAVDSSRKNFMRYRTPYKSQESMAEICEDRSGKIWIGSTRGIQLFDPATASFALPAFLPQELKSANINVLFKDRDHDIWIGTRDPFRLYCYHASSGETEQVPEEKIRQFLDAGSQGRISSITEDSDGLLWFVSVVGGGILCYDKKKDHWSTYPAGQRNRSFLVNKGIVAFAPGEDGNLWLSTVFGDGLVRYHYPSDSITLYTREDGLLTDYIQTITADNTDNLWLTSGYGITQFSRQGNHRVSNILYESSRFANSTMQAAFDARTGLLVTGMFDRYLFIATRSDLSTTPAPTPLLDKIEINNQEIFTSLDHPELRLDHTEKNVTIEYTAVHFTNADKLRFAYLLEGADEDWKYSTVDRSAQYAALSPGSYVFKVKVANETGNWSPEHQLLSFTILPPVWKTTWFLLTMACVVIIITTLLVRKRIQTIRYEAGLKQKIAETEMMALRAQMNPHFIFNCINSIDSLIQGNDKYHATIYLNKFAKLIRSILDSSKQSTVTLAKDLDTLKLYIELEQFRADQKFTAEINADPTLLQEDFKVPPLIIQPYVENAIQHGLRKRPGNDGRLSISLHRLNGHLQYIIEDNGVGRMHLQNGHSTNKASYGMAMSSDRVKLFNQEQHASVEITDLSEKGKPAGTRVQVLLKMQ